MNIIINTHSRKIFKSINIKSRKKIFLAIDILINSKEKLLIPKIIGKWVYKNIIYTKEYSKKFNIKRNI